MNFAGELPIRVLGIFPTPPGLLPLAWIEEVGELSELFGVDLEILTGKAANVNRITQYLRTTRVHTVIWSGHGQAGGLLDSDGNFLSAQALAAQLRPAAPYCAIIAACYSGGRDDYLQSITEEISLAGIHAVGYPAQVTDRIALLYNREFLRGLVSGANFAAANHMALQALRQISADLPAVITVPAMVDGLHMILNRLDSHGQRLTAIEQTLAAINLKLSI